MNETKKKILGYSEIPPDGPRLEAFDALFVDDPSCEFLIPTKLTKQAVSREVFRSGFRTHFIGYFASRVNQALVTFESALEKHACRYFESYSEILSYKTQPYPVNVYFFDKFRTVYPDFELTLKSGHALIDIRYIDNTKSPKFKARCAALKQYAAQRGYSYTLLTEQELITTRTDNSKLLLSFCKGSPHTKLIDDVKTWLNSSLPMDFNELVRLTSAYPSVRAVLAGMILDGALLIDWDLPIQSQSVHFGNDSWLA
jgi:hypothetical protein